MSALALTALLLAAEPFATSFDPWRGVEVSGAVHAGASGVGGEAAVGLRLRGQRESVMKSESTWLHLHAVGLTRLDTAGAAPTLTVEGYQGLFRRHVREGILLLPLTPPVSLPFPLDISLLANVARFERRWAEGADWTLEPLRVALLFDPVRSASSRFHLGLGVTTAWTLHQVSGAFVHEVTPLSAGALFFTFESEDGLWLARGQAWAGATLDVPALTFSFRARGEVELSRVVAALNDQPFAVFLRASGAWRDAGARGGSEWTVSAGLQLRLFSARAPSPKT